AYQEWKQLQGVLPSKVRHIAQQFKKTSRGRVEETASPSPSSQQLTPPRPVIFAAVVKVKEFESKKDNPASLFGQAFFYWIGEQQQWKTTLQNMGIQKLPNDSELPANKEAELVVTYSTQWRGDFPKNSLAVQIALKKEQPSQSDIYQLPRECNIFNYGFQKG
ncbi:MAG: hypothetical protein J6V89_00930, partial [Acetobacter sp.]|nr:hypothetical protein [Acetobacter sp.]